MHNRQVHSFSYNFIWQKTEFQAFTINFAFDKSGFWETCVILYFIKELLDKICKAEKDIDSSFLKKGCTTEMSDLTTNPEAVSNFNKVIKPVSESIKLIGLHTEGSMKQKV